MAADKDSTDHNPPAGRDGYRPSRHLRFAHEDYAAAIDRAMPDPSLWPVIGPSPEGAGFILTRLAPTRRNDTPPVAHLTPNTSQPQLIDRLPERRTRAHMVFCPVGSYLLDLESREKGGDSLTLWAVRDGSPGGPHSLADPRTLELEDRVFNVALSADGSVIALASATRIRFIEAANLELIAEAETAANPDDACALAIDPKEYSLIVPDLGSMQLIPLRDRTIDQPLPFIDLHQASQDVPGPGSRDFNPEASADLGPAALPFAKSRPINPESAVDEPPLTPENLAELATAVLGREVTVGDLQQTLAAVGMTWQDLLTARADADAQAQAQPPRPGGVTWHEGSSPIVSVGVTRDSRWLHVCSSAVMRVYDWHSVEEAGGELPAPAIELYAGALPGLPTAALTGPAAYDEQGQRLVIGHSLSGLLHLDLAAGRNFNLVPAPEGMTIRSFCLSLDRRSLCCIWEPLEHDPARAGQHRIEVWDYQPLVAASLKRPR